MLNVLNKLLSGGTHAGGLKNEAASQSSGNAEGFRPVQDAKALLGTTERRNLIRTLKANCPFSDKVFETWWLEPMEKLAARVQETPAAWAGLFCHPGGFIDLSLNITVSAVKLVRGMMLPPGATPEEQAEQSSAWVCAVYWAALFHHLEWLLKIESGTADDQPWYPGMSIPTAPWRIRPGTAARPATNTIYLASRLLPESGVLWLQRWPMLSEALLIYLSGRKTESCILHSIVSDALCASGFENATEGGVPTDSHYANNSLVSADSILDDISPKLSDNDANSLSSKTNVNVPLDAIGNDKPHYDCAPSQNEISVQITALASAFELAEDANSDASEGKVEGDEGALSTVELLGVLDHQIAGTESVLEKPLQVLEHQSEKALTEKSCMSEGKTEGDVFFAWLKQSVNDGSLTINERDSLLHVLAGYVFLVSPDCFFKYLSASPDVSQDKSQLQKSFENLNIHHLRNGKGLYHYHKYDAPDRKGRFTKMTGYMILPGILFKEGSCPRDSMWLSPKI